jgi:hypothetical protein
MCKRHRERERERERERVTECLEQTDISKAQKAELSYNKTSLTYMEWKAVTPTFFWQIEWQRATKELINLSSLKSPFSSHNLLFGPL